MPGATSGGFELQLVTAALLTLRRKYNTELLSDG